MARWLGDHNHEPEVEYPVDRFAITVDLASPSLKLAIEVDGGCHTTWKQQDEDCRRDSLLQRAGWKVIRKTNDETDGNLSISWATSLLPRSADMKNR